MDELLAPLQYDLRWFIQLVALSALLTLIAQKAFSHNPISRRAFIVISGLCLFLVPIFVPRTGITWPLALTSPPTWSFTQILPSVLIWVWWLVAMILVTRRLVRLARQVRQQSQAPLVNDPHLNAKVAEMVLAVPGVEAIKLISGNRPCASTIVTNRIFVPSTWRDWSDNTLTAVLAHELVHVRRKDDRWLLLADLLSDWYWWLPWLRNLRRQLCQSMEESADDRAAEWFGQAHGYLEGVHAAAIQIGQERLPTAPGMMFLDGHPLVERVSRFLEFRNQELDARGLYWGLLAALVTVPIITGITFVPYPQTYRGSVVTVPIMSYQSSPEWSEAIYPSITSTRRSHVDLVVIDEPNAVYPGSALLNQVTGEVEVTYVVTANGKPVRLSVVYAEPKNQFDQAALQAVAQSRYEPFQARSLDSSLAPGASVQVKRNFRFALAQNFNKQRE